MNHSNNQHRAKLDWDGFWTQFTEEQRRKIETNTNFIEAFNEGDIGRSQNIALDITQPRIIDPKTAALYRKYVRLKNDINRQRGGR